MDTLLTAADSVPGPGPVVQPAISTRVISDLLGRITDYGCRVMLFVDGVHELPDPQFKSSIKAWVRDLRQNRRVITFVASKEGPSDVNQRDELGLFAQGVVNALQGAGAKTYTLEAFRRKLHQEVLDAQRAAPGSRRLLPRRSRLLAPCSAVRKGTSPATRHVPPARSRSRRSRNR